MTDSQKLIWAAEPPAEKRGGSDDVALFVMGCVSIRRQPIAIDCYRTGWVSRQNLMRRPMPPSVQSLWAHR